MTDKHEDNGKVDAKTLLDNLWRARDIEIQNLWQRSIFLATIIVLLFTLFFGQLDNMKDKHLVVAGFDVVYGAEDSKDTDLLVLCVICEAGFLMSVLWIAMARGSKTSYERIEGGIDVFQKQADKLFDGPIADLKRKMWFDHIYSFGTSNLFPVHGDLKTPEKVSFRQSIKNGCFYSLSKVNIAMGYIFVLTWAALFLVSFIVSERESVLAEYGWIIAILIAVNLLLWLIADYFVLSDNQMGFISYFWMTICREPLMFHRRKKGRGRENNYSANKKQQVFLSALFFNTAHLSEYDKDVVRDTMNILRCYCLTSEYTLQHKLLERLVQEHDCHFFDVVGYMVIRQVLSDNVARNIVENALMYRSSLNGNSDFILYDPTLDNNVIAIKSFPMKVSFSSDIDRSLEDFRLAKSLRAKSFHISDGKNIKFFVDHDWRKLRAFDHVIDNDNLMTQIEGDKYYIFSDQSIGETGFQYIVITRIDYKQWYNYDFDLLGKRGDISDLTDVPDSEKEYSIAFYDCSGHCIETIGGLKRR